ncbi:MAG: polysaccharide biosynthesis C-terminal domain-containing protein [Lachnospiraceae bacterium]|nr:polysaccharide biosynthesis C-terminal domain-containing protein [Lachnospiraceae bacterium]
MGKYKYLAGNIALFSISNFVSKILVFLLVPFYTNVLSTSDYGIADVMQTTLLLLVPMLTVNMGEAALRYGIECPGKRSDILRAGIKYTLTASVIVLFISALLSLFFKEQRGYLLIFILLFGANSLYEFLILFFQGCEQVKIVVCGSVFSTLVLILCNLFFLLVVKLGIYGYILSQIIAFTLAGVLMLSLGKKYAGYIYESKGRDESFEKELTDYGKPMIAYSTGAWINNASDRYLVSLLCGVSVNGLYGVAYKIPSILMVFQRIFAQSWQMSATKSYNDENSSEFFSAMYRTYQGFMVTGCSFLILTVRAFALFMFRKDFYPAYEFVPPLLISVVFGALTGFIGSICLAHKDSKAMGISTFAGAVINVVLNLLLIPVMGAMGAAVATAVSYYIMYVCSMFIVKKHVKIDHSVVKDHAAYILLVVQAVIMIKSGEGHYVIPAVIFVALILIHIKELMAVLNKLRKYIHK